MAATRTKADSRTNVLRDIIARPETRDRGTPQPSFGEGGWGDSGPEVRQSLVLPQFWRQRLLDWNLGDDRLGGEQRSGNATGVLEG